MNTEKYLEKIILFFKEEGLSMSMDEIAKGIGAAKKTLYNKFESKEDLISKCLVKVTDDFCKNLQCIDNPSEDVRQCFRNGIEALRTFFREMSPLFLKDMMNYYPKLINNEHQLGSSYFIEQLKGNIERGKKEGIYRKDIDQDLIADYISFSIFAYFRKSVMMGSKYSADHYFSQVIEFCLNALEEPGK